jgi:hypothetical protein
MRRPMAPLPTDLQRAIEQGELTEPQLRELFRLEAQQIGLSYERAIELARARKLPRNHIGADLELLVSLLPAA